LLEEVPMPQGHSTVADLADVLDALGADPANAQACILALIGNRIRAVVVAAGIDEALAEVRRRRAKPDGGASAFADFRAAA
jgi:hypothetical protein